MAKNVKYVVFLDIPNTPRRWYTGAYAWNVFKWSHEYPDAAYLTKREAKKVVKEVKNRNFLAEIAEHVCA